MSYNGWLLSDSDRESLLKRFPPKYPYVIAHHHVTKSLNTSELPAGADIKVVGYADDREGVECLVVTVNGTTEREIGGIYHITWSIDRASKRKPHHSNSVISKHGYTALDDPIDLVTAPYVDL